MKNKFMVFATGLFFLAGARAQAPLNLESNANGLTQHWSAGGNVTRGQIVKLNSSGQVVPVTTADSTGAFGIAVTSATQNNDLLVSISGSPLIQTDGACVIGDRVSISTTFNGLGHCSSTASGQIVATSLSLMNAAGFISGQLSSFTSAATTGGTVPSVTSNPATCTTGQTFFNTITSQLLLCIATNTLNTASGAPATTIDVTVFGVKANAKMCADGTVTNASPNISSAGQCQWTSADVGKKIFVTNLCSGTICSFSVGLSSTTILPSTQVTVARIGTVTDATHIIADCTSPGTCSSPNATATDSGQAVIIYGDDDTTALNNAFASMGNAQRCPTFLFPAGMIFYNSALFATLPSSATNACTSPNIASGSLFKNFGQAVGNSTITFMGWGPTTTVFIPTPDFNFGSCSVTRTSCFTGWLSPVFINFGIWGGGQSLLGAGVGTGVSLISCNACIMLNTNFSNWGSRVANSKGIDFGGGVGFAYANNIYTNNFGGGGSTNGGFVTSGTENQLVNSTIGGGSTLTVGAGSTLQSSNNIYYGPTQFNTPTIDVLAGQFFSTNDHILTLSLQTAPTPALKVENGGYASVDNLLFSPSSNANDQSVSVVNGGTLHVSRWKSTLTTLTSGGTIAGTFFDEGGNTYGGPLTITASTASIAADGHSVEGICTGVGTAASTLGLYGTGPNVTLTTCTSTTIGTGFAVSGARTLGGLAVTATAAGTNASSGVVTVLVDGAGSTITCTIGTGTSCSDNTHTVAVTNGQRVSIQFTTQAADTLAGVKAIVFWN